MLRRWLCRPLTDVQAISRRAEAVDILQCRPELVLYIHLEPSAGVTLLPMVAAAAVVLFGLCTSSNGSVNKHHVWDTLIVRHAPTKFVQSKALIYCANGATGAGGAAGDASHARPGAGAWCCPECGGAIVASAATAAVAIGAEEVSCRLWREATGLRKCLAAVAFTGVEALRVCQPRDET